MSWTTNLHDDPYLKRQVITIYGPPKIGKAQPLDAKVLTPLGFRLMGDLKPGDLVIGSSGKPVTVVAVYPQGKRPVFRVTMGDGGTTECCNEHLWFTMTHRDKANGQQGSVKTLSEIMKTLTVGSGNYPKHNHHIPLVEAVEFERRPTKPMVDR